MIRLKALAFLIIFSFFFPDLQSQDITTKQFNQEFTQQDLMNLEFLRSKILSWQMNDFKNITADEILDTLGGFELTPNLEKLYNNARSKFNTQIKQFNLKVKLRESIDAVEFVYDFLANKVRFDQQYYGKYLNISGVIYDINKDRGNNAYLLINPDIKCTFPNFREYQLNSVSLGELPTIKGKYTGATPKGNSYLFFFEDCQIIEDIDMSSEQKQIWNYIESFINNFEIKLQDEITLVKNELFNDYYIKGQEFFNDKDYSSALEQFKIIQSYEDNYKDTPALIESLETIIQFNKAQDIKGKNNYLDAYLIFFPLAYQKNGYESSLHDFKTCFTNFYDAKIKNAQSANSIREYVSVFDSLKKYYYYDTEFISELYNKWQPDFKIIAKSYFTNYKKDYKVIPSGNYRNPLSGIETKFGSLLLVTKSDPDGLLPKCYHYANESDIRYPKYEDWAYKEKILNWLNLRYLSKEEMEYIEADGWANIKEKELFNESLVNYNVVVNANTLCINLDEITGDETRKYFAEEIRLKKQDISYRIEKERERAYSTGKVPDNKLIYLMPRISYLYAINDWYHNSNTRLYQTRSDLSFGIFIGLNRPKNNPSRLYPFNGFGVNIQYFSSIKGKNSIYPLKVEPTSKINQSDYKFNGLELELQYRALMNKNATLLAIGYSMLKSKYSFKYENQLELLSREENISAISSTLGLCVNDFPDVSVLFFMKIFYSTNDNGQFALRRSGLSGNIFFGISFDYQIKLFRIEPNI